MPGYVMVTSDLDILIVLGTASEDTHPQAQLGLESNTDESNTSAEKQQHLPQVANFQSLNTKKKLQNHVHAAYFCAQHAISSNMFPYIMGLQRATLTDETDNVHHASNYLLHDHDGTMFFRKTMGLLTAEINKNVIAKISRSPIFTFSCDAAESDLAVLVCYWNPSTMSIAKNLLALIKLENGHDASGMHETIEHLFEKMIPEWKSKLEGFTADGASGNGVRRAHANPGGVNLAQLLATALGKLVLVVHCSPHRLPLAFKDVWLGAVYLHDLDDMIHALHYQAEQSTRAKDNLVFGPTWQVTVKPSVI